MGTKVSRRNAHRPGKTSLTSQRQPSVIPSGKVCSFWLAGKCKRNPCRFLHSEPALRPGFATPLNHLAHKQSRNSQGKQKDIHKRVDAVEGYNRLQSRNKFAPCSPCASVSNETTQKICEYWMTGNCVHGEKCKFQHSWSCGNGLSMLTQLEGHKKAVTGITLPLGSDMLFSGSKDGTVRVWNCHTGKCIEALEMGSAVGCLISEGPWVFVGIENAVKAWNIQTNAELTLGALGAEIYAMSAANEMLLAGVHDGSILVWKFNSRTNSFEVTASLKGHAGAVVSLVIGAGRLYSGSMDKTIRAWDLENMQCIHTLNKHSEVVMSMVCWDQFLLSCSLDQTLKIWAATAAGDLEVVYNHNEEHGIISLCGMTDAQGIPILFCSCNDNSIRLYELPSFTERGRTFARQEVRTIEIGPGGLFFTGDGTGRVSVWKLSGDLAA